MEEAEDSEEGECRGGAGAGGGGAGVGAEAGAGPAAGAETMRDGVEGTRGASGGPLALAGQGGALGTFDAALMGYDARARAVEEAPTGGAVRETTLSPSELDRERFDTFT